MSTEDGDSQVKAHSALVDFFVMFKRFRNISAVSMVACVIITFSFIMIMSGGPIEASIMTKVAITLISVVGMVFVLFLGLELYWIIKKRKTHRDLLQIHSSFIHRSYVTMFELIRPEGETKIDKLFNHLSLVFPELEKIKKRLDKKRRKFSDKYKESILYPNTETTDTYAFKTETGMFILKIFKITVKWEHVEKMIKENKIDQLLMADDVMRVIYLADEYDPFFESDDFISKMKETKRNYKIDLILENNLGYSTIWIDR